MDQNSFRTRFSLFCVQIEICLTSSFVLMNATTSSRVIGYAAFTVNLQIMSSLIFSTHTVLVLKKPKTASSVRKVFMPKAVAEMLVSWKEKQDVVIEELGGEYQDFNLVFAGSLGLPTEGSTIDGALKRLIKEHDLPPVVFHSLRHSSITYKLKLNGGDIKAVQGDSGHAQAKMVTDQYSHILDDNRKTNAQLFQEAFYEPKTEDEAQPSKQQTDAITPEMLTKILANPEMQSLLLSLAKSIG